MTVLDGKTFKMKLGSTAEDDPPAEYGVHAKVYIVTSEFPSGLCAAGSFLDGRSQRRPLYVDRPREAHGSLLAIKDEKHLWDSKIALDQHCTVHSCTATTRPAKFEHTLYRCSRAFPIRVSPRSTGIRCILAKKFRTRQKSASRSAGAHSAPMSREWQSLGLGKAKIIRLPARMMLVTLKRPMTYYPLAEALTCSPCEYLTLETLILSRN